MATKLNISKNISNNTNLSFKQSQELLEKFLSIISKNSKTNITKISNFGVFFSQRTKERIGRNPKTKESYIIKPMFKTKFKASTYVKQFLNI